MTKYLFILNPISGTRKKADLANQISSLCKKFNLEYSIFKTTGNNDMENITNLVQQEKYNHLIAAGGDGTVHLVADVIINSDNILGIIPTGSANSLSKELNIPKKTEEAFELLLNGKVTQIDTLKINGKNAYHIADIGFNARIIKVFSRSSSMRGMLGYIVVAFKEYFSYRFFNYKILVGEKEFSGTAFMLIITNCKTFGKRRVINPGGIIDDGIFEISIIKKFAKIKFFHILQKLYWANINSSPFNEIIRAKNAIILNPDKRSFHIDGEPLDPAKKIEVAINPQSLKVIVPANR